jgi:predicted MFS family arabinose efflux permease
VTTGPLAVVAKIVRNPDLRRVLGAFFLFNTAEFGTWVAILLYAYARTGPTSVGVVALLQLVPAALAAPPAAALGDRYPRHRVLLGGYVAQALAMALTAVTMAMDAPIVVVYLAAALAATSIVITRPTQSALLPSLSKTPEELTAANGAAGVVEGTGVLLGPLLAAVVLTGSTPTLVFALAAAGMALAALLVAAVRPSRQGLFVDLEAELEEEAQRHEAADGFRAGLRVLLGDPDARVVVGLLSMRMLIIGAADVLFVLMALEILGMGAPGAGILNAALGAGTIAGGIVTFGFVGRSRLAAVAAVGAVAWGSMLALATLLASPTIATLLIVVGGAGLAIMDVAGRTILQRSVRDEVLSRVFGLQEGLAMAALAAGSLLVPILVLSLGLTGAVLVCAALLPVAVGLSWSRLTALDLRTVVPTRAIALLRIARVFAPLPAPPLEAVARRAVWRTVPAGTEIIRQGDAGDTYYLLSSGSVRVTQDGLFIRDLATIGNGFGEIALLHGVPRTATVTAIEECELLTVDRHTFLDAVTGHSGSSAGVEPGLLPPR